MSNEPRAYSPEQMKELTEWVTNHRSTYINSGGAEGHIVDMSFLGGYRFEPMLLLRYIGRKSGNTLITGLGYTQFGSEIAIVASKGAADDHPLWYLNIKAGGPVAFQIATQAFNATWREPEGSELEEAWTYLIKSNPLFGNYRKIARREIPVILLNPLDEIPVFKE